MIYYHDLLKRLKEQEEGKVYVVEDEKGTKVNQSRTKAEKTLSTLKTNTNAFKSYLPQTKTEIKPTTTNKATALVKEEKKEEKEWYESLFEGVKGVGSSLTYGITEGIGALGTLISENAPYMLSNEIATKRDMADYEKTNNITEETRQQIIDKYIKEYGNIDQAATQIATLYNDKAETLKTGGGLAKFQNPEKYEQLEKEVAELEYVRDLLQETRGGKPFTDDVGDAMKAGLDWLGVGQFFDDFKEETSAPFDQVRELGQNTVGKTAQDFAQEHSFIGGVTQSIGALIPAMAATALTKQTAVGTAVFAASAKGSYYENYLEKGYTNREAENASTTMAAVELGTEFLGGWLGGVNVFKSGALKEVAEKSGVQTIKALGIEGIEEATAELANIGIDLDLGEDVTLEEASKRIGTAFASGVALGAVMKGAGVAGSKAQKLAQKISNNEQVTEAELNEALEEVAEQNNTTVENLLEQEANELQQQYLEQSDKIIEEYEQKSTDVVNELNQKAEAVLNKQEVEKNEAPQAEIRGFSLQDQQLIFPEVETAQNDIVEPNTAIEENIPIETTQNVSESQINEENVAENAQNKTDEGITIENEVNDFYSGETFSTMTAKVDGKVAGTLEYSEYEGKPSVKMVEVSPEYRRRGIGTKLLQELQKAYPDTEIDFGMLTDDGAKLIEKSTYTVENREIANKMARRDALQEKIDEYDKTIEESMENDTDLPEGYAADYNEIYDELQDLNEELRGKKATKRLVRETPSAEVIDNVIKLKDEGGQKYAKAYYDAIDKYGSTAFYKAMNEGYSRAKNGTQETAKKPASNSKASKQYLEKQFEKLTGDSILRADAVLGGIELRNNMRQEGNRTDAIEDIPYSKEAMELYQKYKDSKKSSNYLYHTTSKENLQSILEKGLTTDNKARQEGVSGKGKLYLAANEELASSFGKDTDVLFRINPKYNFENLESDLLGGEGTYSTTNNIPVDALQVKENGKWVKLENSQLAKQEATQTEQVAEQVQEAVKPLQETVSELTEQVKKLTDQIENAALNNPTLAENVADTTLDQQVEANNEPTEMEDTTPDFEDDRITKATVESPFDNRDIKDVGNRKVKAYMYENPEVKPYFQEAAQYMLGDLKNTIKGERIFNSQLAYEEGIADQNGAFGWVGIQRQTTEDIGYLKDTFGYTYDQIEEGLNKIIEDNGLENNAVSKRIEFMLDERLRNGYADVAGMPIPANQDYINLLDEKQISEYNSNRFAEMTDEQLEQELARNTAQTAPEANIEIDTNLSVEENIYKANDIDTLNKVVEAYESKATKRKQDQLHNLKVQDKLGKIKSVEALEKRVEKINNEYDSFIDGLYTLQANRESQLKSVTNNVSNQEDIAPVTEQPNNEFVTDKLTEKDAIRIEILKEEKYDIETKLARALTKITEKKGTYEEYKKTYDKYNSRSEAIDQEIKDIIDSYRAENAVETAVEQPTLQVSEDMIPTTENSVQQQWNEEGEIADTETIEKKTKKEIQRELLEDAGIVKESLDSAKDVSKVLMHNTDPIRLQEIIFGKELGDKINNAIFQKVKHNTAEKIRFQNKERAEIKELGIKPRSKESAAVQKYGEKQYLNEAGEMVAYKDAELAAEFPDVDKQEKIKHAAKVIRQKYDAYIDMVNEEITKYGYDAIPKRQDYMRHFQELNDIFSMYGLPFNMQSAQANDLPVDINGLTADLKPGKNWFSSALKRKGNRTTYDAVTGIDGYIEGIGNLIYHTGDIQTLRGFEDYVRETYGQENGFDNLDSLSDGDKAVRIQQIQNNHLGNYAAWLREYTNALAGKKAMVDRAVEDIFGRKIYSFLNELKSQVGSNMTGLNIGSALTNPISMTQALAKTNKLATVKGYADTIKNMFVKDNFAEQNDFLTARFGSDILSPTAWQKMRNAGQIFMTGTDWFASNSITRSKYYELKAQGMSDAEAHKQAGEFAARILGDRSQGATPTLYNSKMLGLVTQFQLEVNNQLYSQFYDTFSDAKQTAKDKGVLKAAAGATFVLGQLAAFQHVYNNLYEAIAGRRPAFDILAMIATALGIGGDEEEEKPLGDRLYEAADMLLDSLPYVSIITGGGRIPISEAMPISELISGTDQYGNEKSRLETLGEALPYYFLPTGYGQLKKTVGGLGMYDDELPVAGSYTDGGNLRFTAEEDTWSKIQAGLFGQWANDNAKEYIDSGFKSIDKENIDELAELGYDSKEYNKYKTGLNEIKKMDLEDGEARATYLFDYIEGLNATDKQKSTMIRNLLSEQEQKDVYDKLEMSSEEIIEYYDAKSTISEQLAKYTNNKKLLTLDTESEEYKEAVEGLSSDKKAKIIDTIINANLTDEQKAYLYGKHYSSDKTLEKITSSGVAFNDYLTFSKDSLSLEDTYEKVEYLFNANLTDRTKTVLYETSVLSGFDDEDKYKDYKTAKAAEIDINAWLSYKKQEFKADKDRYGESIDGTKKKKVFNYINSLDLSIPQKAIMIKLEYPKDKDYVGSTYNYDIVKYVDGLDTTYDAKVVILENIGFEVDSKGNISW